MRTPSRLAPLVPHAATGAVGAGALACATGFYATGLYEKVATNRFAEILLLMALVAAVAWPLRRWKAGSWATAIGVVWLALAVLMAGPLPFLAAVLLAAVATALGGIVAPGQPVLAWVCGLAMIAGTLGWLLPLPVHRWWLYLPVAAALLAWRRASLRPMLAQGMAAWRDAVAAHPAVAAWAVMLLGATSAAAWAPTMQYDDLAYHLGVPWWLMQHARYAADPGNQVWSYAPWAGDILQAVPQVLARAEARGAVNLGWFAITAAGLWRLGGLVGVRGAWRWAAVALFASLPCTAVLLGGMQTEAAAAATTTWLAVVAIERGAGRRRLACAALLFGLLCALKPVHAVVALPLLLWAGVRHRGAWRQPGLLPGALLLAVAVGGSSYAYAWSVAGNPLMPLFNDVFGSPYFKTARLTDSFWQQGWHWDLPWQMTFHSRRFVEGWDGAVGLVPVAFAGAWALAFATRGARVLALCATLAMALPMLPMQYSRYAHPGMVLLLPAIAAALQRWCPPRPAALLVAIACLGNLALQPNAGWILRDGAIKRSLLALGRDAPLFERFTPERVLAAAIRERAPDSGPVLVLSEPYHAEFTDRGRTTAWYSWHMRLAAAEAETDPSGSAWAALLRREGIAEIILKPATLTPPLAAGLERLGAQPALEVHNVAWWRIPPAKDTP